MLTKPVLLFALAGCALAQAVLAQGNNEINSAGATPEEILIEGERYRFQLREQIYDAEDNLYALFNSLNDEKRFKITCTEENRNNSRVEIRLCLPEFQRDANRVDGRAFLDIFRTQFATLENPGELVPGNANAPSAPPAKFSIDRQQKELQAKMQKLASETPEFLDALVKYTELKEGYQKSFSSGD